MGNLFMSLTGATTIYVDPTTTKRLSDMGAFDSDVNTQEGKEVFESPKIMAVVEAHGVDLVIRIMESGVVLGYDAKPLLNALKGPLKDGFVILF